MTFTWALGIAQMACAIRTRGKRTRGFSLFRFFAGMFGYLGA
jgi:hypothetical protein